MHLGWLARIAVAAMLACGSLLVVSAPGAAQQKPSPAAIAAAKELLILKGGDLPFNPVVYNVIEKVKNVFLPTNPNLGKELNEVAAQLKKEYEPKRAELINDVARMYAERFSEQEIKTLITFYKSPLGRKMVTDEPKIIDQSLNHVENWGNELSDEVLSRFREEMKKKGHDL
ncbi:MAG: DUF2059 domain-containing protein [Rhodoplanes sp.]|jgi:hypothetical protein